MIYFVLMLIKDLSLALLIRVRDSYRLAKSANKGALLGCGE